MGGGEGRGSGWREEGGGGGRREGVGGDGGREEGGGGGRGEERGVEERGCTRLPTYHYELISETLGGKPHIFYWIS